MKIIYRLLILSIFSCFFVIRPTTLFAALDPTVCGTIINTPASMYPRACKVGQNQYTNYTSCGNNQCCTGLTCVEENLQQTQQPTTHICGETWDPNVETNVTCDCPGATTYVSIGSQRCCGWLVNGSCSGTNPSENSANNNNNSENTTPGSAPSTQLNIFAGPTSENFNSLNPLKNFSDGSAGLTSPGAIVSRLLQFAFPLAGLILFAELVWGGFEMLIGATSKGIEAGKQRVTNALVGFLLLFVAYWIFQIVEVIFGVVIL